MDGLLLLVLEAALALALLLFIVWWTWPRRKPPEAPDGKKDGADPS
jgi:hypothetical protein